MNQTPRQADWRRVTTYLASWVVAATYVALWVQDGGDFHVLPALYILAFVAAPFISELPNLGARLAARAFWLQSTFLYTLLAGYAFYRWTGRLTDFSPSYTFRWEHLTVPAIWGGAAVALLAAGVHGLNANTGHFTPTKFRKTMLASLVLGAADLMALGIYATIALHSARSGKMDEAGLLVGCALVMALALAGLFRLRVWGLVACVAANFIVAGLALSGALGLPEFLAGGLAATAIAQLFIPIPMAREIFTGLRRLRL